METEKQTAQRKGFPRSLTIFALPPSFSLLASSLSSLSNFFLRSMSRCTLSGMAPPAGPTPWLPAGATEWSTGRAGSSISLGPLSRPAKARTSAFVSGVGFGFGLGFGFGRALRVGNGLCFWGVARGEVGREVGRGEGWAILVEDDEEASLPSIACELEEEEEEGSLEGVEPRRFEFDEKWSRGLCIFELGVTERRGVGLLSSLLR